MRLFVLLLLSAVLFVPLSLVPQESGAAVAIRFSGGTNQFHIGEVIPVELSFSASVSDTYDIESRSYDRSGRANIEQFHVNPPGRDPLVDYFAEGTFLGGGLGGPRPLTNEPYVIGQDLNEWVALDKPGHYTLYITTSRVSRRTAGKNASVELRSNTLDFDIIAADSGWEEQTFRSALAVLNDSGSKEGDKAAAIRTLRFLDTPESIHELIRRFDAVPERHRFDCIAGLAGSRYQQLVVRELEQQMSAPDTAITSEYLYTLSKLKFQYEHSPLPAYPRNDPEQQKLWSEAAQQRQKQLGELQDRLYAKAVNLVSVKQGHARTETVRTLLMRPSRGSEDVGTLAGLPDSEITSSFLALSPDEQYNLLAYFWQRAKVPAMLEPLENLVEQPEIKHQMLRDVALQRLYELAPQAATLFILAEIKHPHVDSGMFTVKAQTLGVLPNETLPEFDPLLARRIEQKESRTFALDAQLIARYATKSILPRVKTAYEAKPGLQDCVSEDGFISYFLRTDADYGVSLLAREPSFCMTESIPAVIRVKRWNEIQPSVIDHMNNPDLNRARQAAETLAKYGDADAEKAMWERLRRFHQQWAGRESELVAYRAGVPREVTEAMGFQYGLVESLARAQNWTLTDEQVSELEKLTLGSERDNVKQFHWTSPVEISISVLPDGHLHIDVHNQFFPTDIRALQAKLKQYPSGTRFKLTSYGQQTRMATVLQQINDAASQNGLSIEVAPAVSAY